MNAGPLDVLAVLNSMAKEAREHRAREGHDPDGLAVYEANDQRAIAAVAELVEAARRAYAVLDGYVTADDSTDQEINACDDFWAALVKFGGGK